MSAQRYIVAVFVCVYLTQPIVSARSTVDKCGDICDGKVDYCDWLTDMCVPCKLPCSRETRADMNTCRKHCPGYTKTTTTTTTTTTPMPPAVDKVVAGESRSLSTGAIIGIVVGCGVAVLAALGIGFWMTRNKSPNNTPPNTTDQAQGGRLLPTAVPPVNNVVAQETVPLTNLTTPASVTGASGDQRTNG